MSKTKVTSLDITYNRKCSRPKSDTCTYCGCLLDLTEEGKVEREGVSFFLADLVATCHIQERIRTGGLNKSV